MPALPLSRIGRINLTASLARLGAYGVTVGVVEGLPYAAVFEPPRFDVSADLSVAEFVNVVDDLLRGLVDGFEHTRVGPDWPSLRLVT